MEDAGAHGGVTVAQYDVEIAGRTTRVGVERSADGFIVTVDGRALHVDMARIGRHLISLIVDEAAGLPAMASQEIVLVDEGGGPATAIVDGTPVPVSVDAARRRGRASDGAAGGGGPQRVAAPMSGKVVRVLVAPGDVVRARQPLVVVEAMKMENELRATREGTIADVRVREGQSVDAGALLVVVQA